MNTQRIMTITAKSLFKYFPKKKGEEGSRFYFDVRKKTLYPLVVKNEVEMDDCPLFYQFLEILKIEETMKPLAESRRITLYDQFLIMDFEDVFLPIKDNASEAMRKRKEELLKNAKNIIENGFDIRFEDHTVHMMPFDKSGNMSRNSRISFVNAVYIKKLNERLNLGMDFSNIKVKLSKYYAYRGLYLSTSQRVEHDNFKITPETLVIIRDRKDGYNYERDVLIATAEQGDNPSDWKFLKPYNKELEYVEVPHDGVGLIAPEYAEYINEALGIKGANSFQIRLPFAKGMLHQVDIHEFINEFGEGENRYIYTDAFGIERDLRKARIFLTESMLKGTDWLKSHCKDNQITDPMQFYCNAIRKYHHGFYVSGTNLPYGYSKYTHLSYQSINTLAFEEEQFDRIMKGHGQFIESPIEFVKQCNEAEQNMVGKEDGEITCDLPNWKRALVNNPKVAGDKYVKEQLRNVQKSLLTKMATGKILVEGQTRYLCRDLIPLMADFLQNQNERKAFCNARSLYTRFYLPCGDDKETNIHFEFEKYYAFFRNPHLSRNEQFMMRAFVLPESEETYVKDGSRKYEKYVKYVKMYDKYFGHLTGIVMIPRGSSLPLCLGGADFDGDLVSVIFNQDVVAAVEKGVYTRNESPSLYWCDRILPTIKIPSTYAESETVPETVPYQHIYNTFSNYIGQISNASISIGQKEYDRKGGKASQFQAYEATCAKCTLLTGLEIDAAKNGIHPNLDIVLNAVDGKCEYLKFLESFRTLQKEEGFRYEKMLVSKANKGGNIIHIDVKKCNTKVEWDLSLEEVGTYINLLPKYFLQYFEVFKKSKNTSDKFNILPNAQIRKDDEAAIDEFKNICDDILKLYSFYSKSLLKALTREKNKGYHAVENAETLIMRMYDEDQADERLFDILPKIRTKIESAISEQNTIQDIRERINIDQWQFQPKHRRAMVLEQIIGNGFKASDLTENEADLLYHFNQQGYKMLWRIMDLIEGPKFRSYDELYEIEKDEKLSLVECINLNDSLKKETRDYYEKNVDHVAQSIYAQCLSALKKAIGMYSASISDPSVLVGVLYKKTRTPVSQAKFFWDSFLWKEMQHLFVVDKEASE